MIHTGPMLRPVFCLIAHFNLITLTTRALDAGIQLKSQLCLKGCHATVPHPGVGQTTHPTAPMDNSGLDAQACQSLPQLQPDNTCSTHHDPTGPPPPTKQKS